MDEYRPGLGLWLLGLVAIVVGAVFWSPLWYFAGVYVVMLFVVAALEMWELAPLQRLANARTGKRPGGVEKECAGRMSEKEINQDSLEIYKPSLKINQDIVEIDKPLLIQVIGEYTGCKEYREFSSWLRKRFPNLITYDPRSGLYKVNEQPPDGATPADMDEAIILISEEYARRCKAMSTSHEESRHPGKVCIHDHFRQTIERVVGLKEALQGQVTVSYLDPHPEAEQAARKIGLVAEAEALRRDVKAVRKKLADKADKYEAQEVALRKKLADKDEAETARRREVKALRKKVEEAEIALREKEQEVEGVYLRLGRMVAGHTTPQWSLDASTSSSDIPPRKPSVLNPYPDERYHLPNLPGRVDSTPTQIPGTPQFPKNSAEKEAAERDREFYRSLGKSLNDPGADWGG
jgi:hypothetical protein